MRKSLIWFSLIFLSLVRATAQNAGSPEESRLQFTANIQNNHLWRGILVADNPVVMGNLSYALSKNKNLKIGIWGASAFANEKDGTHYREIDYYIQYSNENFYIGLWDSYNSRDVVAAYADDDVFNYSLKRTAHTLELRTNYTFGHKFPLNIEAGIMLYGGANAREVILKPDGEYDRNKYSTYVQMSYPVVHGKAIDLNAFLGGGFALSGESFLYGGGKGGFRIVNAGFKASKNIKITEQYTLPVAMLVMWNPTLGYARIQLAVTVF